MLVDRGPERRAESGRLDDVLDDERHALERSRTLAYAQAPVALGGVLEGARVDGADGVDGGVEPRDPLEERARHLGGAQALAGNVGGQLGGGLPDDVLAHAPAWLRGAVHVLPSSVRWRRANLQAPPTRTIRSSYTPASANTGSSPGLPLKPWK